MGEQELLGGLADLGLRGVTVPAAGGEGAALERRRGAIEDEYGADAEEEELADTAEEPEEVRVPDHLAAVVPHRPHELHHPDARVHRHPLPRKGLHRDASPDRSQQFPQPVNSHLLPPGADGRGGGCPRRPATLERRGGATPSRRPGAKGPVPDFLWPSRLSRVCCDLGLGRCRGRERSKAVPVGLVWAG